MSEQSKPAAQANVSKLNNTLTRFLLIGVVNTIVGLSLIFFLLHVLELGYWLSTGLGNTTAALVSYVLNKTFTFRSSASVASSFWKFIVVVLVCYVFSYGVSLALTDALLLTKLDRQIIHTIAVIGGAGLYTICNYFGHKMFSFRAVKGGGSS
jgi:putative flippase GtrA